MHGCPDCGGTLTKSTVDQHSYRYDHGKPLLLREIHKHACACGYYEVEIPRMGPLHETIKQTLSVLRVKRDAIAFIFEEGPGGVRDGQWGALIQTTAS